MTDSQNLNDVELINRLKKDDETALTEIYDKYWKPLFISSYNLLKDKEVCEEIIQDIFIDIWKNREKIQIKISLNSYLYASTRYKVFNHFRKKNNELRVELFESLNKRFQYATPETKLMHQELVIQIEGIVESLPPKCKEVYKMSRDEQLSHKEISDKLNISTKTVENHITKALRVIKASLGYSATIDLALWVSENL